MSYPCIHNYSKECDSCGCCKEFGEKDLICDICGEIITEDYYKINDKLVCNICINEVYKVEID